MGVPPPLLPLLHLPDLLDAARVLGADAPTPAWLDEFRSFTALHLITVAFFGAAMVTAAWLGRCWCETPREARFRRGWGWVVLVYQTWYTAWYFLPAHFTWFESLPLQLCDLAAFVAGLAMITHW